MKVQELYKLMKYDVANKKRAAYGDSWDLRRLYTFMFRRQLDTSKRGQQPRDQGWVCLNQLKFSQNIRTHAYIYMCVCIRLCKIEPFACVIDLFHNIPSQDDKVRKLFDKIGEYRKAWKLQEQQWLQDNGGAAETETTEAENALYVESAPHEETTSTPAQPAASTDSQVVPAPSPPPDVVQQQLAELGMPGGTMTPEQQLELAKLLLEIEMKSVVDESKYITQDYIKLFFIFSMFQLWLTFWHSLE